MRTDEKMKIRRRQIELKRAALGGCTGRPFCWAAGWQFWNLMQSAWSRSASALRKLTKASVDNKWGMTGTAVTQSNHCDAITSDNKMAKLRDLKEKESRNRSIIEFVL